MGEREGQVVCALDLGTTRCKAGLVARDGRLVALVSEPAPAVLDESQAFSADQLRLIIYDLIRRLLVEADVSPGAIAALSVTNQRATIVPLDGTNTPCGPALSWQDTGSEADVEAFMKAFGAARFTQLTGLPPSALWSLGKILRLRLAEPELWSRCRRFALLHDLALTWLGADELTCDLANASLTGLLDVGEMAWSAALLEVAHLVPEMLPQLKPSGTVAGHVSAEAARRTGLAAGTPLVLGGGDQQCAALGIGATEPGEGALCLGTAAVVSLPTRTFLPDPSTRYFCTVHAVPERFVLEGIQNAFGSAMRWLMRLLGLPSPAALDELAAASPSGARGVRFLPHLAGVGSPEFSAARRGVLLGLDLAHTRADVARAGVEGVCLELGRIVRTMGEAVEVRELTVCGGGSGGLLPQVLADLTGLTLRLHPSTEASLQGAAALAWQGAGAGNAAEVAGGWRKAVAAHVKPRLEPRARQAVEARYDAANDAARLAGFHVHEENSA